MYAMLFVPCALKWNRIVCFEFIDEGYPESEKKKKKKKKKKMHSTKYLNSAVSPKCHKCIYIFS